VPLPAKTSFQACVTTSLKLRGWAFALLAWLAVAGPAAAQPFAYVVGQRDPSGTPAVVTVVDTSTNSQVTSIAVGANCVCLSPDSIAIAPDIGRVYVTNEVGKSVSVIDVISNTVVNTIPVGGDPTAIVASRDGTRVYVLHGEAPAAVAAIDTATDAVVGLTSLPTAQARGMALTPDGARLYVSASTANRVIVVSTPAMSVMATIPVGSFPLGVDISPDGSRAYVARFLSNEVSVIDTTTNAVIATVAVGNNPRSARVSRDGTRAYVASFGSSTISIIDTATNTTVATVPNQYNSPRTLDFSPDGSRAYVASQQGVQVIDTVSQAVTATIPFTAATEGYPAAIVMGRAAGGNRPTAVNEGHLTTRDTPLMVSAPGVLGNDDTDGGGAMTALLVNGVAHGTLGLNADGSFTYTPAPGFLGTDSFTYRAVNAVGQSNLATVSLSVLTAPPPTGLYASLIAGNTVTLRWTPPAAGVPPTGYVLEGGVNPGEVLASIPTGRTAPIFTFAAPTGTFHVRVHALAGAEKGAASNEIRIVVNVPEAPSAPANLLGVVNGADLSLAWRNTFEGGAPTALFLDVSGSLSATLPLPLADTFSFAGVPAGTYTLRLRAANASGLSGPSNPVTLTFPAACSGVPATPTHVVASRDGGLVTALWESAPSGPAATNFVVNVTGSFVGAFPTTGRALAGTVGPGSYTITVSATNVCGASPPSAPQTVVVP
jgi:YVTN family beta-propeller protein